MERVKLTIDGMTCDHCVRGVTAALNGVPGVKVERVEIGSAVVAYDRATVDDAVIKNAIADEGYEVRDMEGAS